MESSSVCATEILKCTGGVQAVIVWLHDRYPAGVGTHANGGFGFIAAVSALRERLHEVFKQDLINRGKYIRFEQLISVDLFKPRWKTELRLDAQAKVVKQRTLRI